jgi:NAD(P)-dependent dehydrogenase (short-subunit alcohol dehydrogenase family)
MTSRLKGKVAIVTGAAGSLGAAIARSFAAEGAIVALLDLPEQESVGQALAAELKVSLFVATDVAVQDQCERAVSITRDTFGPPTILVNNAGMASVGDVEQLSEADWDRQFDVNVKSVFLMSRCAIPLMRAAGGGSIINVASESAFIAFPMLPAYCASKAAVTHLSRCMGVRYASDRIRVNALCPGTIDTPLYRGFLSKQPDPDAVNKMILAMHPLGLGTPEEIAAAALYLASEESRYMTASPLLIDGGSTAM